MGSDLFSRIIDRLPSLGEGSGLYYSILFIIVIGALLVALRRSRRRKMRLVEEEARDAIAALAAEAPSAETPAAQPMSVRPMVEPVFDADFSEAEVSAKFNALLAEERPHPPEDFATEGMAPLPRLQLVFSSWEALLRSPARRLSRQGFVWPGPAAMAPGRRLQMEFYLGAGNKLMEAQAEMVQSGPAEAVARFLSLDPAAEKFLLRLEEQRQGT